MNGKLIKIGSICSIRIEDIEEDENYVWQSEIKLFGYVFRSAGFRWAKLLGVETVEEVEKSGNLICKEGFEGITKNKVFWKPRVLLELSDGSSHKFIFETYDEARDFADMIKKTNSESWLEYNEKEIIGELR